MHRRAGQKSLSGCFDPVFFSHAIKIRKRLSSDCVQRDLSEVEEHNAGCLPSLLRNKLVERVSAVLSPVRSAGLISVQRAGRSLLTRALIPEMEEGHGLLPISPRTY